MTRAQQSERDQAIVQLREWIKPGDTVYTVLDQVSRSGMSRQIRVVLLACQDSETYPVATHTAETCPGRPCSPLCDHVEFAERPRRVVDLHPNWAVGKALGLRHARRNGREQDALVVGGAGMDMGYHLVYSLARVLYPEFTCIGQGCPSNDHSNGDRDYTVGKPHSDGGYSLRHRWL